MRGHPGKGREQILQPHGLGGVERQERGEQQRNRHKGGLPPGGGMGHSIANSFLLFPRIIPQNREGRKKGESHPLDLVASFLPAGTLSGAPKIRAMEIIDELESVRRGLYGGATGYIDFGGDMDFCITIRTMVKKGIEVYLQAGAGIVADSVPENEYYECCNKVMALAKTLVEEENL